METRGEWGGRVSWELQFVAKVVAFTIVGLLILFFAC